MNRNRLFLLSCALCASVFASFPLSAKVTQPPTKIALEPTSNQQKAAYWTSLLLQRTHYKAVPLDDAMSKEIFKRFLETLDGEHWFLLQSDIKTLSKFEFGLDDAISEQDLKPPFEIYKIYRQRVAERTAFARNLATKPFKFDVDENYAFDREKVAYAKDAKELDDLWRRRVKNDVLRLSLAGKTQEAISTTLDKRYKEFQTRIEELDGEDVFSMFLNAYSTAIEPHTNYMSPRASDNFAMQMSLSLDGIGAMLQRDGDYTTIASVVKGGPADRQGQLKDFDRIVAVGQGASGEMVDVIGWRVDDVVKLIRGKRNTVVRLDVLSADASVTSKPAQIQITRDKVKLEEQAAKSRVINYTEEGVQHKVGVIELPGFYRDFAARAQRDSDFRSATRDVSVLVEKLKADKVEAIVMDLRNNGGGALPEAIEMVGLFIDKGPVVQVRNSFGRIEVYDDPNAGAQWTGPLTVLVNRASASASEIFAAAIQDYGRGLILGDTTFGKGTVQEINELDRIGNTGGGVLGELKMTTQQFFRVNGGSTQHKGVQPDIRFPAIIDPKEFGESSYENALPYTEIKPANFQRVSQGFAASVPSLTSRFQQRAGRDSEYKFLLEDLAERDKMRNEKVVSLLMSKRKAERDEQETKRVARQKAREANGDQKAADKTPKLDDGLDAAERRLAERKKDEDADKEKAIEDDALLNQAVHVTGDFARLGNARKVQSVQLNAAREEAAGLQ
jgi:carboxyl-terminal processing protease